MINPSQFLKVYQIYFDDSQKESLDYIPFKNDNCTVFFESEVIRKLIEDKAHLDCQYFGVVSYKLKQKLDYVMKQQWRSMDNIANHSTNKFTPELFETELLFKNPDIMSFQRHISHDTVSVADRFHPNFAKYFTEIMEKIGYKWIPVDIKDVFYCNYFVARPAIYEKFVHEMLIPAMEVMKNMPELMGNSNYPRILPNKLKQSFGVNHYPYHSFLCERMFSFYVSLNQFKVLHY